jgi:two-component system, chemotaxis family, CheB/CheR fusion protein
MLGLLMTGEGATVETALSGDEGWRADEGSDFDLIISDISMPGMDGYAFLRGNPRYDRTPAIALTGFVLEEDVEKVHQAGFTNHTVKPIDFAHLVNISRSLLRD